MRSRHLLICLLALAAGVVPALAFADGEDDPLFGTDGTAYSIHLEDTTEAVPLGAPFTDSMSDGSVILAGASARSFVVRGRTTDTHLLVSRLSSTGQPVAGFGEEGIVDVPVDGVGRVMALEVLDDGTIVVVLSVYQDGGTQTGTVEAPPDRWAALAVRLAGNGEEISRTWQNAPNECDAGDALARSAAVGGADEVYVLWTNCEDRDVLQRLGDAAWDRTLPGGMNGREVATAGGAVFALGQVLDGDLAQRAGSDVDSRVVRYGADGTQDAAYGAGVLDGGPVKFDVDGAGRAVVLVEPAVFVRGEERGWRVRRLTPAGLPDATFGTDGLVELDGEPFGAAYPASEDSCLDYVIDTCAIRQVTALADGRVVLSGPPRDAGTIERGAAIFGETWTVARLTAAGALDPAWDEDGVKELAFPPSETLRPVFFAVGQSVAQTDGKLLVPFLTVANEPTGEERVALPAPGAQYGVQRLGLTAEQDEPVDPGEDTPPAKGGSTTTTTATQPAASATITAVTRSASPKRCVSRRRFAIRLRKGRRKSRIVSASVTVNRRKVAVRRRGAIVNLRGLPAGRFTVRTTVRLADGSVVRDTRRYRTCAKTAKRN